MFEPEADDEIFEMRPIHPIHPGEIVDDELIELGMTSFDLARALHLPIDRIDALLAARVPMDPDTAIRLEKWLGPSADFWLRLQHRHDIDVVRRDINHESYLGIHELVWDRPSLEPRDRVPDTSATTTEGSASGSNHGIKTGP